MASSSVSCFVHYVFSTKGRQPFITTRIQPRLWGYIGGTMRNHKMKTLAVGGTADHIHILASLPSTLTVAKAVQLIKGNSSKWIHETFPERADFAWQVGYGAFSLGVSKVPETIAYIKNQAEHHRVRSFQEEYLSFLEKHGIEYDPRHVWG